MSTTRDPDRDTSAAQAKDELERAGSEAQQYASETAETVRERGREGLERAKGRAADQAEELADAIDETAERFDSDDAISGYGHSLASMMRRLAGGLREQDIEEFAGQLARFARRNPATFLAGSVAVGFGVSRFLKASGERSRAERGGWGETEEEGGYYSGAHSYEDEPGLSSRAGEDYTASERWPEDLGTRGAAGGSAPSQGVPGSTPGQEYSTGATGNPPGTQESEGDQPGGNRS